MQARFKWLPDNFTFALVSMVILASFLPCRGNTAVAFNVLTNIMIGFLFFFHGAKLSRKAIIEGLTNWRLHALIVSCTFIFFPLLGLALKPILLWFITPALYTGVLFLCTLPSTVQSSIAFTSIAKGNIPAAICSASASSLLGIFITPALAGILLNHQAIAAGSPWHTIINISCQLLIPFVLGQLLRPLIGGWVDRNRGILKFFDQGSILLVVYVAFSEAVNQGLWHSLSLQTFVNLIIVNILILAIILFATSLVSKKLGFSRADQITIIFCGSKKSLASGVPMAKVIFASTSVGTIVLPLMLFHQVQLMTCAFLAQRWAKEERSNEKVHATSDSALQE